MAKKRVKKSRKKSYLKRNSRRTYRRKIKKTRKKNKRGGSRSRYTGLDNARNKTHLSEAAAFEATLRQKNKIETLEEGFPDQKEILFNETHSPDRTFDVLEILYGGDPEEVGAKLKLYNNAKTDIIVKIWGGHEDFSDEDHEKNNVEYDRGIARILKQIFPEGYPTYILINGHGSMIDCRESIRDPCFTLLPRGYKLILATATGESLISSRKWSRAEYDQINSSYYRMYEGLVPNQEINFNLVYKNMVTKELLEKKEIEDTTYAVVVGSAPAAKGTGYVNKGLPGVYITGVKAPVVTRNIIEDILEIEMGREEKLDYYINFRPEWKMAEIQIQIADAKKVNTGEATIPEITQYANAMVSGILPLPETPIKDYDAPHSIMPIDKIKEQIINTNTRHIPGQPLDRLLSFKLSELLKHIEIVGETNINVPKVILGSFCRSGDFNSDIVALSRCRRLGPTLPPLTAEYFTGSVSYEGLSPELRRNMSLASKTKTQDFWSIYDNLKQNLEYFTTIEGEIDPSRPSLPESSLAAYDSDRSQIVTEFQGIINKIEVVSSQMVNGIYKGINLTLNEVCLIFQMDNCLKLHPHGMPYPRRVSGAASEPAPSQKQETEVDAGREGGAEAGEEGR
jgi:hypothetical protein